MRALRRLPVHMSYNVTALDRDGLRATAYLAPDRPAHVTSLAVATNHQEQVEWAPYAAAIRSVERRRRLEELLTAGGSVADVVAACLRSPLYATRFHEGFGTLYTAEYRPAEGGARYHWPGLTWEHSLGRLGSDGFRSARHRVSRSRKRRIRRTGRHRRGRPTRSIRYRSAV
jgi:predicted choloylglycine hydrolase